MHTRRMIVAATATSVMIVLTGCATGLGAERGPGSPRKEFVTGSRIQHRPGERRDTGDYVIRTSRRGLENLPSVTMRPGG